MSDALDIRQLINACEAAGLAEAIAPVKAALDRRDAIEKEFSALLNAGTDVRPTAARIAAGEINLADGVAELGPTVAMFDAGSTPMIRHLRDFARRYCLDAARTLLTENAAALLETVETVTAKLDADLDKPAPPGITSDVDAARAGATVEKAWLRRKAAAERRTRLGDIHPVMERLGLLKVAA